MESLGQNKNTWQHEWEQLSPESEIRMWDFYGGRQWISKFIPRFGKSLEAGCGLGRYNFYFSKMGIDIEGLDFSEHTINFLNNWQKKHGFNVTFKVGDVTNLPYENSSLRGYVSLGVIEHFIEGPEKAIAEACRVLEPGGIAIITTPSISWNVFQQKLKKTTKDIIKKIIHYPNPKPDFFQYEFRPKKLKKLVEKSGLLVTEFSGADLLYPFTEIGNFTGENIRQGSFAYWFANRFEKTFLRTLGAQSIAISVKAADEMFCFLCGEFNSNIKSLSKYSVPICGKCQEKSLAKFYLKNMMPIYSNPYIIDPPLKTPGLEICDYSGKEYLSDKLFEDFGFTKKVSLEMLMISEINIELCNKYIKPIWRKRKKTAIH